MIKISLWSMAIAIGIVIQMIPVGNKDDLLSYKFLHYVQPAGVGRPRKTLISSEGNAIHNILDSILR